MHLCSKHSCCNMPNVSSCYTMLIMLAGFTLLLAACRTKDDDAYSSYLEICQVKLGSNRQCNRSMNTDIALPVLSYTTHKSKSPMVILYLHIPRFHFQNCVSVCRETWYWK
jgi:hypothetical protein